MILSCAAEESNPVISRDYHLLRRMIDTEDCFIEVTALGEELAMDVIRYTFFILTLSTTLTALTVKYNKTDKKI